MTEFSVNTRNRFALGLDDEEDTDLYELLEKEQADKQRKSIEAEQAKLKAAENAKKDKRNTSVKTNTKKVANQSTDNSTNTHTHQSTRDNAPAKPSYTRNDENRPPRLRNANQNRAPSNNENVNFEKPPQDFNRERKDGGYRGRGRGMRGGFVGNRPRREYERHSGSDKTGVKAVEKRDGSGPHNWGDEISSQLDQSPVEEQQNESVVERTANVDAVEGEGAAPATEPATGGITEGEANKEEEKPVMTYEEYLAKNARTKAVFFENTRKANEGVDMKQWKKTTVLQRKKKGDMSEEEYDSTDEETELDATKSTLEKLNIQVTFGDRRGRGRGFGGPRGRGGFDRRREEGGFSARGAYDRRGGKSKNYVPEIDNENFPTLGSR